MVSQLQNDVCAASATRRSAGDSIFYIDVPYGTLKALLKASGTVLTSAIICAIDRRWHSWSLLEGPTRDLISRATDTLAGCDVPLLAAIVPG